MSNRMRTVFRQAVLIVVFLAVGFVLAPFAHAQTGVLGPDDTTFTFANVEIVAVDVAAGTVVFRNPGGGATRTVAVLPGIPGFQNLAAGDRIIVGIEAQRGTGVARITSIQFPVAPSGATASGHQAGAALTNLTAQVVDVDSDARTLTVRLAGMGDRVLQVSESVSGLSDLSRGDRIRIAIADGASGTQDLVTEISPAQAAAPGIATPPRGHLSAPGGARPGASAPGTAVPSPTPTPSPASSPASGESTATLRGQPAVAATAGTASPAVGASAPPHTAAGAATPSTAAAPAAAAPPVLVGTPVQVVPGAAPLSPAVVAPSGAAVGGSFFGTGPGVAGPGTPAPNVVTAPAGAAGPGVALAGTAAGVAGTTGAAGTTAATAATVAGTTVAGTTAGGTVTAAPGTAAPGTAISGGFGGPPAEGIGLGAGIFTTPAVSPVVTPLVSEAANAPATTAAPGAEPDALAVAEVRSQMGARDLSSRLATFAQRADEIDRLWMRYRAACEVDTVPTPGTPRAWFVLWEGGGTPVRAMDACDDYYDEIVRHGEALKIQVSSAADSARSAGVMPGTIRDLFAAYSLDWSGWDLPRPEPRRR